ncbi:MAG: DUF2155 domain-containing protein [Candidatus Paracaedibacteraceae bacterium]|nr:DUF2155 domain-containing protein [Candidatus Paracaedibacteraceae bacterium]
MFCIITATNSLSSESTTENNTLPIEEETNLNTTYAELQWVDKFTGKFKLIYAKVGETTTYEHLKIYLAVCRKSAAFEPPESKAFLTIWEHPKEELPRKLFSGWMLASSPALSTLTNHPRYSLWLLKCTNKIKLPLQK